MRIFSLRPSATDRSDADALAVACRENRKFSGIQSLRALAIGLVLLSHLSATGALIDWLGLSIGNPGWIGVELFFVVSGFVIIRSAARGGPVPAQFAARRFFRIYPSLAIFFIVCLAAVTFAGWLVPGAPAAFVPPLDKLMGQLRAITLWQYPDAIYGVSYANMALWSLVAELKFYAGVAILLLILRVCSMPAAATRHVALFVAVAALLIGWLHRLSDYTGYPIAYAHLVTSSMYDFIALGVIAGALPEEAVRRFRLAGARVYLTCVLAGTFLVAILGHPHQVLTQQGGFGTLLGAGMLAVGTLFLAAILAAASGEQRTTYPFWSKVGDCVGERSYLIFLMHLPVLLVVWAMSQWLQIHSTLRWCTFQLVVGAVILLPLVEVLHRTIEVPAIRLGRHLQLGSKRIASNAGQGWSTTTGMAMAAWQYRFFIQIAVVNDLKGKYLRSSLGALWLILNPFAQAAIYVLVLSGVLGARLPSVADPSAYAIYLLAGLAAWNLFTEVFGRSLTMFIDAAPILKKTACPRICLPLSVLGSALATHAIFLSAIAVIACALGHFPSSAWLLLPFGAAITAVLAFGMGIAAGVLNVFVRDTAHVVAVALPLWFWLTPIVYPMEVVPAPARNLLALNPVLPLVQLYQDAILYGTLTELVKLAFPLVIGAGLVLISADLYWRARSQMVDEL